MVSQGVSRFLEGDKRNSRRMENLLTIALEAHNDDLNHHRRYEITVGRDLLNDWTLSIRYGRVGGGYQTQKFAGKDEDQILAIVRERLRRRRSAPKRIGCAYRVTMFDAVAEFDASAWLPDDSIVFLPEPSFSLPPMADKIAFSGAKRGQGGTVGEGDPCTHGVAP
jgi:predicted DNA-binding WGR domain protein